MTQKNYKKEFTELDNKLIKKTKFIKHNKPKVRTCGLSIKVCKRCGRHRGHIDKYGLNLCRQCFRELAKKLGFKKYN